MKESANVWHCNLSVFKLDSTKSRNDTEWPEVRFIPLKAGGEGIKGFI